MADRLLPAFAIDLRYALRLAARSPLFTLLTVTALALGIGSVTAMMTVANGVLLKPLPYERPNQLVMIWSDNTREKRPEYPMSPANFLDMKASLRALDHVEAMFSFITLATLKTASGSEQIAVSVVSPGMFALLGRSAALGRTLDVHDTSSVVLSDAFFTRRFGRDSGVIGRRLTVDNAPASVVGVMPPDFTFPYPGMLGPSGFTTRTAVDAWAVLDPSNPNSRFTDTSGQISRSVHFLSVLGRLMPGATLARAQDEATAVASRLERAYPDANAGLRARVVSLHEQSVGRMRPALMLLGAGAALILLLAAINVANLLLARSVSRQKEMAVRAALGAGRSRLMRQALAETLLLAFAGAGAGLMLAAWSTRAFVAVAPHDIPRLDDVALDWGVVGLTVAVAGLTGLALAFAPFLVSTGSHTARSLADTGRGHTSGSAARRLRSGLAVAEIALAVVLTVGAGLLMRSFVALLEVNPGFQPQQLLTFQITLPQSIATPDARRLFYRDLFTRLEAVPGVLRAGGTTRLPLGSTNVTTRVEIEGRPADRLEVEFRRAVQAYFATMGMPILRGRDFSESDGPGASVVIVNETMSRMVWGDENPVGKRVRTGGPTASWSTVVGVVGDVHHANLDTPAAPELYINYLTGPPVSPFVVLRTVGNPATLASTVRSELKRLDKDLVVYDFRTGSDLRSGAVSGRRFIAGLATLFGVLAITLATVGVYGVMTLMVTERRREMGIRLALGAEPRRVLTLVVVQAMTLAGIGAVIGIAASLALTPLMAAELYGVRVLDPITLTTVPLILGVAALLACSLPAWRAMRVDPLTVLRDQ